MKAAGPYAEWVMTNAEVAAALYELARLTVLEDGSRQSFRARAYEGAARAIELAGFDVAGASATEIAGIKGVGPSSAKKVRELVDTGSMEKLERLRSLFPPGFAALTRVPGIGPKTAALLRDELGVTDVESLRAALEAEALRELPGLGRKTEEKIAEGLARLAESGEESRTPILRAIRMAADIEEVVQRFPGVERTLATGSLRRFAETVGDLDILVQSGSAPGPIMESFVTMGLARSVIAHGDKKSSILTIDDVQVDLRVVTAEQFGAAALYFTGSRDHNIVLRQRAIDRGWLLNEYGLLDGDTIVASTTEEEIYAALGLVWIPPTLRENTGEVEAAAEDRLPATPRVDDLRGDLHVHTDRSGDGHQSLEAVVRRAVEKGYEYLAITDHGEDLTINGLSRDQLRAQRAEMDSIDTGGLHLLQGCELNIDAEGGIDYDADFLTELDFGVASVHSHFDLDPDRQTARVIAAMENPAVNVIGHLTGRRIGRRPGIRLDVDAVLAAAERTRCAIEINSHLDRLDAPSAILRRAVGRDVLFAISTDSHRLHEMDQNVWGVRNAERGWVDRDQVVNTWGWEAFSEWVLAKRSP